jgi:hypothetical protein
MNKLPFQQALERIRAEYQEMPGMKLTLEQVERLSGVDRSVCQQVLDALVNAKFLSLRGDRSYTRAQDGSRTRLPAAKADWNARVHSPGSAVPAN